MPVPALNAEDLSAFHLVQQRACHRAQTIVGELGPGIREQETAARMTAWRQDHGVRRWQVRQSDRQAAA
ncbi:hypothetical protein [Pseudomonas sp. Q1-7]|uniref:hypothetical protein n=1 Tax=Pseudomonas sp. Q1-7 TaxID=3020843 RepID=UPI0023014387|nr:hypothetical protein [Pseudomonas sp. Q1-7]